MKSRLLQVSLFSVLGGLLYAYLYYSELGQPTASPMVAAGVFISVGLSNALGLLLNGVSLQLDRVLPWRKLTSLRLLLQTLLGLLASSLVVFAFVFGYSYFHQAFVLTPGRTLQLYLPLVLKLSILGLCIVVVYTLIDLIFYSYREYAHGQIERIASQRKQLELQFEALRNQLSPHYLFNSLNTISSLIEPDPQAAETFIRRLVQTYQYILASRQAPLVSLAQEIEFVKAYNYLLRVRFAEALQIQIDLPELAYPLQLPPLSLQMLVENAVKHNVISDEDPLIIRIYLDGAGNLLVSNNFTMEPAETASFKVGLENIRRRYAYFTRRAVTVIRQDKFEVVLPLLAEAQPEML